MVWVIIFWLFSFFSQSTRMELACYVRLLLDSALAAGGEEYAPAEEPPDEEEEPIDDY